MEHSEESFAKNESNTRVVIFSLLVSQTRHARSPLVLAEFFTMPHFDSTLISPHLCPANHAISGDRGSTEAVVSCTLMAAYSFFGVSPMSLEGMRELLKGSLRQTLGALPDEDKLAAAWPVACGKAMAERGTIVGYADGVVRIQVENRVWLRQLMSMRGQLAGEMARITGVRVSEIHFEMRL
jgi:Dna[CI] antecedent, DciA